MMLKTLCLIFLSFSPALAQTVTYSKAEETGFHRLNMAMGLAKTSQTVGSHKATIDSIWQFLGMYPRTIYKSALFSYLLDLNSDLPSLVPEAKSVADSVLKYDSLSVTKLWVGEILITRSVDLNRGIALVRQALPDLTVRNHLYRAYSLLAQVDFSKGNLASADLNIRRAIAIDSTRYEAWFDYLAFSRIGENTTSSKQIQETIRSLEKADLLHFDETSKKGPLVFRSLVSPNVHDSKGTSISLRAEGKVQVINFFAFWCGACAAELPHLAKLSRDLPQVDFRFVNTDPGPDPTNQEMLDRKQFNFLKKHGAFFATEPLLKEINLSAIPRTIILDKKGLVRFDYLGYATDSEDLMRRRILQLLAE